MFLSHINVSPPPFLSKNSKHPHVKIGKTESMTILFGVWITAGQALGCGRGT